MRERPVPRLSRLPSMGSQQRLPWPSVCGSLELTARSRRSSSSAWILPSRGSVCPFSHPCFRWSTLLTDKIDILFSFPFFHPLLPSSRQQVKETCFSFFCLLASISLRIPWEKLGRANLWERPTARYPSNETSGKSGHQAGGEPLGISANSNAHLERDQSLVSVVG